MNENIYTDGTLNDYISRITKNGTEHATSADIVFLPQENKKPAEEQYAAPTLIEPTHVISRRRLEEDYINREMQKIREDFIKQCMNLEQLKYSSFERKLNADYQNRLSSQQIRMERARRIIRIQNAILSRVYDADPETIIGIMEEADISEEDMELLSGRVDETDSLEGNDVYAGKVVDRGDMTDENDDALSPWADRRIADENGGRNNNDD